jgi:predicted unusual protein kinase regulating ubiquinone biosynthesis (AarF/ABC1/UbiB family)
LRESGLPLGRIVAVTVAAVRALAGATFDRLARRNASFDALLARRIRRAFERLGPTLVKLGQIISSSSGSLPGTWVAEGLLKAVMARRNQIVDRLSTRSKAPGSLD